MSFDSVDCWLSKVILKPNAVEDGSEQPLMEDKAPIFSSASTHCNRGDHPQILNAACLAFNRWHATCEEQDEDPLRTHQDSSELIQLHQQSMVRSSCWGYSTDALREGRIMNMMKCCWNEIERLKWIEQVWHAHEQVVGAVFAGPTCAEVLSGKRGAAMWVATLVAASLQSYGISCPQRHHALLCLVCFDLIVE